MKSTTIAVVGLGYVGLPLAVAFGRHLPTIGYDLSEEKIASYRLNIDPTGEVSREEFAKATRLSVTSYPTEIATADVIIVAVPTPIDDARQPDLRPLIGASRAAGTHMKPGALVVFESTVYPGVTEEICVPVLEEASGLKWKTDFHVGYSPERINPGDREHTLSKVVKVVAGDDEPTTRQVADLYRIVVEAGVHPTRTIKEAEAAKVIENTQRDLNIALMNELAVIFDQLGIDTQNVLAAAGTKWNFLSFRPGLVGGHCIGVDPYYLTHRAEKAGYHPEVILAGRRINDSMGKYIAEKTVKTMISTSQSIKGTRVGVLGFTFKEDCSDLRNTKVVDIVRELESYGVEVLVHDPQADVKEAHSHHGIKLSCWEEMTNLGALIIAVAHREYKEMPISALVEKLVPKGCLIDVKAVFDPDAVKAAGVNFWRL